ncbi:MAG: orotate phosphoribosyltransferase [Alphaproteobacteria bacterium]|nr:orotate phosphoribosyltransferase [Alphaproteobacteria bacterium]
MTAQHILTPNARDAAKMLFDIKAVLFNAEKPFTFTSGTISPVYVDCRKIVSYPKERRALMTMGAAQLKEKLGTNAFDMVAGGETAGIPFGAWLSEELDLPMIYVRKKPKGFGRMAQIEGDLKEGARVLLVEDLASEGTSKIKFCEALRNAGAIVEHTFVIFHYGIFPQSIETLKAIGVDLHGLCTWWDALAVAREMNYFDAKTLDAVEAFLKNPNAWSAAHGEQVATA